MDKALRRLALWLAAITIAYAVSLWANHSWAVMLPLGLILGVAVSEADSRLERRRRGR